jgi:hypothetical protein
MRTKAGAGKKPFWRRLAARPPHGKGRLSAGPQAPPTQAVTSYGPAFPTARPQPRLTHHGCITEKGRPERLPVPAARADWRSTGPVQVGTDPR